MRQVKYLFWNPTEKRWRAGWRIAAHFVLWIYIPAVLNFALGASLADILPAVFQAVERIRDLVVEFGLRLPAILLSTWFMVRWIDRRPFAQLGFQKSKQWWLD